MTDISTRWPASILTVTSYERFIASTLLITASTMRAPSVVVRRHSSSAPPNTSATPVNALYGYEYDMNAHMSAGGENEPSGVICCCRGRTPNCTRANFITPYWIIVNASGYRRKARNHSRPRAGFAGRGRVIVHTAATSKAATAYQSVWIHSRGPSPDPNPPPVRRV